MNPDVAQAREHNVGTVLRRTALRYPDKPAIVWKDRRLTFAEFDREVNATANALAERGVAKGERVVVLAHNSLEFVVSYLALARLGAISVPVNFMLPAPDVAFILEHSGASGFIAEDALLPVAEEAMRLSPMADGVRGIIGAATGGWESVADWGRHPNTAEPDVLVADDDPIQLMYTSGTESRPKGVTLTSRSLISQFVGCVIDGGMTADDVEIHALPFYHCAQLHVFFGPDLYIGSSSIILPGPDPELILRTIEAERVTKLFCPPTVWIALLRHPRFDEFDLSSLTKGYYGASPMPAEVLKELSSRLPEVALWNLYGQTEMAPLATTLLPHEQLAKIGSAGRPSLNVETLVVDDDDNPVPLGEIGEIVHRSPHAMIGYWNDEERTAAAFRNGWFHSGDLGVFDEEGYLYVVDRKKDMIKTGGENVASREVEEALFEHPAVAEVAVFAITHPYWVEAVTAIAVAKAGQTLTAEELLAFGRKRLAGYKAPKYAAVCEQLPKNPSGKVLKRDLREQYAHLAQEG